MTLTMKKICRIYIYDFLVILLLFCMLLSYLNANLVNIWFTIGGEQKEIYNFIKTSLLDDKNETAKVSSRKSF